MLPEGFHWERLSCGASLYCGNRRVAFAVEASPGNGWRLSIDGGASAAGRYVFLSDEAACVRYMAAWANKWHAKIREYGGEPPALNAGAGHMEQSGECVQSRHPGGGRSRRRSPLA